MTMARATEAGRNGRRRAARWRRPGPWRPLAGALRAGAGVGALAGLALTVGSLARARPFAGVPGWAWLALAFACLLVREASAPPDDEAG